jgi:SAM-dependent methyltransferase
MLRGELARQPYDRGVLALFAELIGAEGGGPVADVGCGPGRLTAHLHALGIEAFGIDLSPGMVDVARRDHPGVPFEVGSMTDLQMADSSLAGVLAWSSLIHVPDEQVPTVLAQFHRVLRPGGVVMLAFFIGDDRRLKTQGYGGHPMNVHVYWRPLERMAAWLRGAGFAVEMQMVRDPDAAVPGGILIARCLPSMAVVFPAD